MTDNKKYELEEIKNYIKTDYFNSLLSNENLNDFDILKIDELSSIFLRNKSNNKDSFIITSCPCPIDDDGKIFYQITMFPMDFIVKIYSQVSLP